jgi:hypothetical protein
MTYIKCGVATMNLAEVTGRSEASAVSGVGNRDA